MINTIRILLALLSGIGVAAVALAARALLLAWLDRADREMEAQDAEEGGNE